MITFERAKQIARERIGPNCGLLEDSIIEKPYGWFLSFQSKAFLRSGDISDMLVGSSGFIVERADGRVFGFGSAYPPEKWIANYEKGFKYNSYDLTITDVRCMPTTVKLLEKLDMIYVIPEEQYGVVWRIPQQYTAKQLREALQHLPCTFRRQQFDYRVEVFDEINAAGCCTYTLQEHVPDGEPGLA